MSDNEAGKRADRFQAIYEGARLLLDLVKLSICLSVITYDYYMLKYYVACRAGIVYILLFQNTDGCYLKQDCRGRGKSLDFPGRYLLLQLRYEEIVWDRGHNSNCLVHYTGE